MKSTTFVSLAAVVLQASHTTADSVCSSGLYAALAPLETYAPAVSYCQGQAGKTTVTVSTTVTAKAKREPATTASTKTTATTLKTTTTTTSSTDAKASSWSSLVAQAKSIVATFCSCAGYPATTTVTTTSTAPAPSPTAVTQTCSDGTVAVASARNEGLADASYCQSVCDETSGYGLGCIAAKIDANGVCINYESCCPGNLFCS